MFFLLIIIFFNGCIEQSTTISETDQNNSSDASNNTINPEDYDGDGYTNDVDAFPNDASEWRDSDNDGIGDNKDDTPYGGNSQEDIDGDGVINAQDAFPYDYTQWSDRDGDGYGDNPSGRNNDAFPDDRTEWKDSDRDNIGDNVDFYDKGNGGILITVDEFHCDEWPDELGTNASDPYFVITVEAFNERTNKWESVETYTSPIYEDTLSITNQPTLLVDIHDGTTAYVLVDITVWDSDIDTDDIIDINDETIDYFNIRTESIRTYSFDGRSDHIDELDGWIVYTVKATSLS